MLIDTYGRKINYLRISVTDRCDLRCTYCIPKGFSEFEKPKHWLSFDEIERVVRQFAAMGTTHFRLTGGEPLLRKNIVELVHRLKRIDGVNDLSLSTNATQLAHYADDLYRAGLDRLNVSLDSLSQKGIQQISGYDAKQKILEGLEAAKEAGFKNIKINMVLLEGVNEDQIDNMVVFCMKNHFILRLIELMPMGETARKHHYINLQSVIKNIQYKYNLQPSKKTHGAGPARYWESLDGTFFLGYITPLSQHFCQTCNRIRMAVDGTLYMCLGDEHHFALAPILKSCASDEQLRQTIREAINLKPEQHDFIEKPLKIVRNMAKTGG
ncbi:GTP 3',8-cyclase MoaA [Acinetobacter gerneri]|uniref:GTP 3',8-cyclase MoaA n=1 Tax=Acinetobacter gerneri TaxID=202952 RepID=UPI0028B153E8|nr:GTP 3',8-cyclase MoaA [Acinetobacter gerneri]